MMCAGMYLSGCSNDTITDNNNGQMPVAGDLLYEKPGLIDSLNGTCSAYLVRNFILDTLDMSAYSQLMIELKGATDGDRSNLILYYIDNGAMNLIELEGLNEINGNVSMTIPAPDKMSEVNFRMLLFASVCTGHYYNLTVRDLKIYGIQ
jgi:hypothetical protein